MSEQGAVQWLGNELFLTPSLFLSFSQFHSRAPQVFIFCSFLFPYPLFKQESVPTHCNIYSQAGETKISLLHRGIPSVCFPAGYQPGISPSLLLKLLLHSTILSLCPHFCLQSHSTPPILSVDGINSGLRNVSLFSGALRYSSAYIANHHEKE